MPQSISLIMMITGIVLLVGYIFIYHYKYLGRIFLRALIGGIAIGATNYLLLAIDLESGIGINYVTLGIVGILGVPGFILLYFTVGFLNVFY